MIKIILIVLGILSVIYGGLVFMVGSGTGFWLVWELIGGFFFLWALLLHKEFFVTHKIFKMIFHSVIGIGITMVIMLCSMIAGEFAAKGKENLDYIIVLGAQVRENGPSVVLQYRLDKAIDYLNENPDTMCIVTGGQGMNEPFPEAEGMAEYLLEKGIDENRIILEDQSQNTVQNIQYSKEFLRESYNEIGIVTNNFHMFRAIQIAKAQRIENVCGIAAYSNPIYLPNNVLRECMGIVKDWIMNNI